MLSSLNFVFWAQGAFSGFGCMAHFCTDKGKGGILLILSFSFSLETLVFDIGIALIKKK